MSTLLFFLAYFQRGATISWVFFPKQPKLLYILPKTFPHKTIPNQVREFSATHDAVKILCIS